MGVTTTTPVEKKKNSIRALGDESRTPLRGTGKGNIVHRGSLFLALLVTGCASTPSARNAVQECKRYLPKASYEVVDLVELKNGGIWQMIKYAERKEGTGSSYLIEDYFVHWPHLETWGKPPVVTLVMLEAQPDTLVMCEVSTCTPWITWLKRVRSEGRDKWQIEKTNEKDQVCVVQ